MARGRMRRFGVAFMAALMVATSFSHVVAPPVAANIVSLTPANSEVPEVSFKRDEPIYAIVGADRNGGFVCAGPADVVGCSTPGVGIGPFQGTGEPIPLIKPGLLGSGRYRLYGYEPQKPISISSIEFTVTNEPLCGSIDTTICDSAMASFKFRAGTIAQNNMVIEGLSRGGLYTVAGVYVMRVVLNLISPSPSSWGFAWFGVGLAAIQVIDAQFGWNVILGIANAAGAASKSMKALAADPPDPNYMVITEPVFAAPHPAGGDPTSEAIYDGYDHMKGYADALLHALERYQGAMAAGDAEWMERQAAKVAEFSNALADAVEDTSAGLAIAADETAADPDLDHVFTQEDVDAYTALGDRIIADGFTPEEVSALEDAGLTAEEIGQLRDEAVANDGPPPEVGTERLREPAAGITRLGRRCAGPAPVCRRRRDRGGQCIAQRRIYGRPVERQRSTKRDLHQLFNRCRQRPFDPDMGLRRWHDRKRQPGNP